MPQPVSQVYMKVAKRAISCVTEENHLFTWNDKTGILDLILYMCSYFRSTPVCRLQFKLIVFFVFSLKDLSIVIFLCWAALVTAPLDNNGYHTLGWMDFCLCKKLFLGERKFCWHFFPWHYKEFLFASAKLFLQIFCTAVALLTHSLVFVFNQITILC